MELNREKPCCAHHTTFCLIALGAVLIVTLSAGCITTTGELVNADTNASAQNASASNITNIAAATTDGINVSSVLLDVESALDELQKLHGDWNSTN